MAGDVVNKPKNVLEVENNVVDELCAKVLDAAVMTDNTVGTVGESRRTPFHA